MENTKMDKKTFCRQGTHQLCWRPSSILTLPLWSGSFGPLGIGIAQDLGLSHSEKGLMVATPVLAGALPRIVMGILVDRLSPKKAAIIGPGCCNGATMAYAWLVGVHPHTEVLILVFSWGVAGLPPHYRWPRAGIRQSIKARQWALLVQVTQVLRWRRYFSGLPRVWWTNVLALS